MGSAEVVSTTIVATTIYATRQNTAVAWDQSSDLFDLSKHSKKKLVLLYQYD